MLPKKSLTLDVIERLHKNHFLKSKAFQIPERKLGTFTFFGYVS